MSAARRFTALALAAACITGAQRSARAQTGPSAQPPPPMPASAPKRWYGWQILLVDSVGLGAMTAGGVSIAKTNSPVGAAFFYPGFVISNFSGPVVHAFHLGKDEDPALKVGLTYAMRVLLPITGLVSGWYIGTRLHCDPRQHCSTGMIAGTTVGSYVASIIDVTAVAWEKVPSKPAAQRPALRAAPVLVPERGGFVAGLSGTF
ncbi:Hypothetical protein A7982_00047 [Minicystis rosea]|nr:Hypothetical protein A7982_00047 [Minicystis rosea]